jgi:hypothetical protein
MNPKPIFRQTIVQEDQVCRYRYISKKVEGLEVIMEDTIFEDET